MARGTSARVGAGRRRRAAAAAAAGLLGLGGAVLVVGPAGAAGSAGAVGSAGALAPTPLRRTPVPTVTPSASTPAGTAPGPAATTPTGAPVSPASPPRCANAIQVVVGTVTSPPTAIPRPTSSVGGSQLSANGLQVDPAAGAAAPPVLPAAAWVVADATTGAVLAACNAHVPFMPASTIKTLTALALEKTIDRKATYVALAADAQVDGTKVGLSPGSTYTGDDLWHGLLMASGNDTAHALADLAGGPSTAADLMAAEARRLGALDTVPVNTSGLDAPGQVTSAYDLALFGREVLTRPYLAKILTTRAYSFPGKGVGNGRSRPRFQIQNHNRLLGSYDGATGVKNGYTVQAGGSFIGSATRGGRSYVVTVLRADGRTSEMARRLLDWAFTTSPTATGVGRLVSPAEVAAGALGGPSATATPTVTATPTGSPTPTAPSPTGSPALAGAAGERTSSGVADAWAAGVVLGATAAFGLVSAVLVLRRARRRRDVGDQVVPGLLFARLRGRTEPVGAADAAPAGSEGSGSRSGAVEDAEPDGTGSEATGSESTGPDSKAGTTRDATAGRSPRKAAADGVSGGSEAGNGAEKAFPELAGLGVTTGSLPVVRDDGTAEDRAGG